MSVDLPVLLALEGAPAEQAVLAAVGRPANGLTIVRRCLDIADLLAVASTGTARAAVVAAEMRRLDHDAVDRLRRNGLTVVGLVAADQDGAEQRLRMLGVDQVVAVATADPGAGVAALLDCLREVGHAAALPARSLVEPGEEAPGGRVISVWGPTGAPGRTTVATYLACELAGLGVPTLLADADTYGGSVAQLLGVLDESPGLAAAARAASAGTLDRTSLALAARQVAPGLRVLTGIVRADRWPELRGPALCEVLDLCRRLAPVTVVDCGFGLEQDEALSYDTVAPQRNAATLAALGAADLVLAVGRADPVGVQRLVRTLGEARAAAPSASLRVVLTRVRRGPVGRSPERQLRETLLRHCGVDDVVLVPDDQAAYDAALASGRALSEVAPRSRARVAMLGFAQDVVVDRAA